MFIPQTLEPRSQLFVSTIFVSKFLPMSTHPEEDRDFCPITTLALQISVCTEMTTDKKYLTKYQLPDPLLNEYDLDQHYVNTDP